jgi:hypothetical protein
MTLAEGLPNIKGLQEMKLGVNESFHSNLPLLLLENLREH